jgi:alkylation response protein AidB-like acyl-CoA dehydrogenase
MATASVPAQADASRPDPEIIGRATALVPLIREHAAQGIADRRLAPEVVKALTDAQLFRLLVPARYGGLETNLRTMMEVLAEVARGDGSAGWVMALLNTATWIATTFSDQAQEEMFGENPDAKACAIFIPPSKCERVDGGYLLSGRWPYASGSFTADWAAIGCALESEEGQNPAGLALVPSSSWTIDATWFMTGMQGTGSDTLVLEDHFVPDHRTQRFTDLCERRVATSALTTEPNAGMAFIPVAALILVGAQLGLARHAMEISLSAIPSKRVAYTIYEQARNSPTHQLDVAEAAGMFDMAELLMQRAAGDIDQWAAAFELMPKLLRARVRNDTGLIGELVTSGLRLLMSANGASSFASANTLSQIWRDSEVACRHALVMPETGKEAYGRMLLGTDEPLTIDV